MFSLTGMKIFSQMNVSSFKTNTQMVSISISKRVEIETSTSFVARNETKCMK